MKAPSSSKYDYEISRPPDTEWHLTFAWYPVMIKAEWCWCCDVMRRRVYNIKGIFPSCWEYRLPTQKEKQDFIDKNTNV